MKLCNLRAYFFLSILVILISGCSNLNVKRDFWKSGLSAVAQQLGRKDCLSYNAYSQQYSECLDQLNDSFDTLELQEENAEN